MQIDSLPDYQYWNENLIGNDFGTTRKNRYVTFDVDQGGLNNIRLVFEYVAVIAAITRRTLVLPPATPWYLINNTAGGPYKGVTNMADVFEVDALKKALPVITTNEFIARASDHLDIPGQFRQVDFSLEQNKELRESWSSWLLADSESPDWRPFATLICFPDIKAAQRGPDLSDDYVDRRQLVEFSHRMMAAPVLHFPSNKTQRSLGPVATMLASEDATLPRLGRRLLKHHLRYRNEIFEYADRAVKALMPGRFNAMHVRRNDFQYKQTRLSAQEIHNNVKSLLDPTLPLYLATDDQSGELARELQKLFGFPQVFQLADTLKQLSGDVPYAWEGTLEKIICAYADRFVGTDLSTFSAYIHRLRGYMQKEDQNCYYHGVNYEDPQSQPPPVTGTVYLRENPILWLDC